SGIRFVALNCAAIPNDLLENQLFGHRKGAFTGADRDQAGVFVHAGAGTVFLDEIGEMSLSAQVRLLRVLEERRVTRIGGEGSIAVDVRVLAASNKDLLSAVSRGEFRRDLYYRLKVVELPLPPLRDRRSDIPLLLKHYIAQLTRDRRGARFEGVSNEAMDLLQQYDWPGNVRELRNLVEQFVFLGPRGPIGPQDVIPHLDSSPTVGRHLPVATHKTPDQSERELIYFALLDLKREVADLRHLLEGRDMGSVKPLARPIYTMDDKTEEAPIPDTRWTEDGNGSTTSLKDLERNAIVRALGQRADGALETAAGFRRAAAVDPHRRHRGAGGRCGGGVLCGRPATAAAGRRGCGGARLGARPRSVTGLGRRPGPA
ncbi:MAG: sigma-54-dependent Fis family transcriptional regulator, partial [Planctomycetes bacterium]|nr:sigma-54-dependent Fis family transcriptional regulator [Planctomycetota bacterium]